MMPARNDRSPDNKQAVSSEAGRRLTLLHEQAVPTLAIRSTGPESNYHNTMCSRPMPIVLHTLAQWAQMLSNEPCFVLPLFPHTRLRLQEVRFRRTVLYPGNWANFVEMTGRQTKGRQEWRWFRGGGPCPKGHNFFAKIARYPHLAGPPSRESAPKLAHSLLALRPLPRGSREVAAGRRAGNTSDK